MIQFKAQIDMINIDGVAPKEILEHDGDWVTIEFNDKKVPTATEFISKFKQAFKEKTGIAPYDDRFEGECAVAYVDGFVDMWLDETTDDALKEEFEIRASA